MSQDALQQRLAVHAARSCTALACKNITPDVSWHTAAMRPCDWLRAEKRWPMAFTLVLAMAVPLLLPARFSLGPS